MSPGVSRSTSYWNMPFAETLKARAWDLGLFLNYADTPLVQLDEDGNRAAEIVSAQLAADLLGAYGITDWLDVGLALPLVLSQSGDASDIDPASSATGAGFALGDLRIHGRASLTEAPAEGISAPMLGLDVGLRLPTGDDGDYQGGELRVEPRLLFDWVFADRSRVGAQLGYLVRPSRELENVNVNDQLSLSASAAVNVGARSRGWIIPELRTSLGVLEGGGNKNSGMELLAGGRFDVSPTVSLEAGTGTGFLSGVGTPDWRVFAAVSLRKPTPEPEGDRDGDGYLDSEDGCPDDPEDFDGFEDEDGCSDPDNDGDGVIDRNDGVPTLGGFGDCMNVPEDADGFEDEDGCPDPDNDNDGVIDVDDGEPHVDGFGVCLNDPEDVDGFEDEDGCPDPDNDNDGVLDVDDGEPDASGFGACRDQAEDMDGDRDEDGCPEEDRMVTVTCDEIEIDGRVYFDTDSDVIQERSYELLEQVAEVLNETAYIHLVSVEGHTDSQGSASHNRGLSQRRAASVVRFLVEAGIAAERLQSEGYGEDRPVDTNDTAEGRQNNRRVEFIIVEQDTETCE